MATDLLVNDKRPVVGDDLDVKVTVSDLPAGVTLTKAWITFKQNREDADNAAGSVQESITSGFTPSGTSVAFTIPLPRAKTALFVPGETYYWDVQVKDNTGKVTTPIPDGEAIWAQGITTAVS